jgi:hypothetical protein
MNLSTNIAILSNNTNRQNAITHSILHDLADANSKTNLIIITEPWIGTIRAETQEKGTVSHRDWHCIAPQNIETANVTIYYRKNSPFRAIPLTHLEIATGSILPIQITTQDKRQFTVIGVYNSPTTNEAANHLINSQLPPGPVILCGDFNLHAPDWDNTITHTNDKAQAFIDWTAENELQILNDPDKPTYHGHNFEHAKVDDLVIANIEIQNSYELDAVQVHDQHHYSSDHYPISINISTPGDPPQQAPDFPLTEAKREEWEAAIRPKLEQLRNQAPEKATPKLWSNLATT